ncbi:heterokaryon incompatibility protein-domain-containing protein [Dichotomopilus funicola]|uniref:Heterokaryon incompatibility protein-domain-containing protein n=1 Tax=Dichotomopilus funicola TaxID=1934379 RepID=A0AAN6ZK92_9PEZI|nr:heterokaryon incompatibility protein-domain-containing protein [Dichotomopilus funicola]
MSRRIWGQVEDTFESFILGKNLLNLDPPEGPSDRTENDVVGKTYIYETLKQDRKAFRLLELLPGSRQDDIACTLTEHCLDDCHGKYDALSYVWGDASVTTPIQVNGDTLMVTTNLRAALLNLRKIDQPYTLWVDAVCIDQGKVSAGKTSERNHQVSIMGDIYRNAARTVVWFGNARHPFTEQAYSMMEVLATEAESREQGNAANGSNYSLPSLLSAERIESPNFDRFKDDVSILHLASADWWHRTWTVQEVLLASEVVVVTGTFSMNWERFCAAIDHGLAVGIWNPTLVGIILDPIVVPYLSMRALRKRILSPLESPADPQPTAALVSRLFELLVRCRFRLASDSRDKVYALLGMIKNEGQADNPLGIEGDYRLSETEVYRHTARQLLLQSSSLDLLGASTPTPTQSHPSWVPDWSNTGNGPFLLMYDARGVIRETHASRHTPSVPRFLDHALLLAGHEHTPVLRLAPVLHRLQRHSEDNPIIKRGDTIAERLSALGQVFSYFSHVYWELSAVIPHLGTFRDWEELAKEGRKSRVRAGGVAVRERDGEDEQGGYDPLAIYWQTLCTGTMAAGGGKTETARLFYAWRASLKSIFRLRKWHADSLLRPLAFVGYLMKTWGEYSAFAGLLEHVYERRLGRGADGSLMLLPERTEVGDVLVLVKGGRQPLVLRQDPNGGQGNYTFVGEAFVYGCMDGEKFEEGKCADMRIR